MATEMEDLKLLQGSEALCDEIWAIVAAWDEFARKTIGPQLVRAVDSIGANVAESYGRYAYGEKIQFLYYNRGSVYETKYWLRRASQRVLIDAEQMAAFADQLDVIAKGINLFVRSLRTQRTSGKATN